MRDFKPSNGGVGLVLTASTSLAVRGTVPGKGNAFCFTNDTEHTIRVTWGASPSLAGSASGFPILFGTKETVEVTSDDLYVAVYCETAAQDLSIHRGFLFDEN